MFGACPWMVREALRSILDFLGEFGYGRGVLSSSRHMRVEGACGPFQGRLCFSFVFSKGFAISKLRFRLLLI